MKTYLLLLVGLLFGGITAFCTFAILFNTSLAGIFPTALFPLGLAAATSFLLVWVEPKKWKMLAASVALPTLLMATLLFVMVWIEGRNGWGWVLVAGTTAGVCAISSWFAYAQKNDRA